MHFFILTAAYHAIAQLIMELLNSSILHSPAYLRQGSCADGGRWRELCPRKAVALR